MGRASDGWEDYLEQNSCSRSLPGRASGARGEDEQRLQRQDPDHHWLEGCTTADHWGPLQPSHSTTLNPQVPGWLQHSEPSCSMVCSELSSGSIRLGVKAQAGPCQLYDTEPVTSPLCLCPDSKKLPYTQVLASAEIQPKVLDS